MTTGILDIPSEAPRLAPWLERQLVGIHLSRLVRELALVHGHPGTANATLDDILEWLGDDRSRVLKQGLSALPTDRIRRLLAQPGLLLPLQEWLLSEGSEYWDRLSRADGELNQAVLAVKPRVVDPAELDSARTEARRWSLATIGSLAAAATLILAAGWTAWQHWSTEPDWGWNTPGLLAKESSPDAHLRALADAGQAWFDQRQANATKLRARIVAMRNGCDRLIADPHKQLDATDRDWLRERCRAWRGKFNEQLAALDQNQPLAPIQRAMDDTVTKLVETLRQRVPRRPS